MPRSPQEQMAMTPEVFKFTREFGRGAPTRQEPSVIQQVAGDLGKLALLGAVGGTAHGLGQILSTENNISPVSTGVMSDVGETPTRVGQKGFVRHPTPLKEPTREVDPSKIANLYDSVAAHDFESPQDDGFVEPTRVGQTGFVRHQNLPEGKYGNQKIPVKDPRSNRFESIRQQEEDRAELDYIMSGGAALDQGFENALALDDARESTFGIPAGRQIGNIGSLVTGPETVIEASPQKSQGLISAIKQEAQDFDHNIPWGERADQAANSNSALGAAGVMAGTVAEKGAKDVGTRVKKIVTGVPQSINTVRNIASDIGETVTREVINSSIIPDNKMQPSKWAEAARLAAGFAPLGGSGGVEIGNESDLSDNAQFDDPQQQNEQITPAGINRQTSGLAPDPVEGEMQTIAQAVNDLATSFGQGLAHLSPEERVDIARKMIEKDLRKDGYQGPINFG
jgi:hypothetical protein